MPVCKKTGSLLQMCRGQISDEDHGSSERHSGASVSSFQSRIVDIERAGRAERAALLQRAERLCASQKAHNNAVLERLNISVQQVTRPSPQPPALPKRRPESSHPGRRIRPVLDDNRGQTWRTYQMLHEEDPCRGQSPDSSTELRETAHLGYFSPTPPPPTAATRRTSRLPVLSVKVGGADKEVADGCKLLSAQGKMQELTCTLQKLQLIPGPSPQPPAAPRRTPAMAPKVSVPQTKVSQPNRSGLCRGTPVMAPKVPVPQTTAPQPNKRGLCPGTRAEAPKVPAPPSTVVPPNKRGPHRGTKLCPAKPVTRQEDLKPLARPTESLSLFLQRVNSDDWEKKVAGLKSVRALVRHHPETLQTNLHEVCLVLAEEVKNLRSAVACAAMEAVADLHIHLGRAMDPEAEVTGRALLLKLAQTTSPFIHQQANLALDALVEGCSSRRIISVLLNTGLSHLCAAVRGSTALHLHQLADLIGEDYILTSDRTFAERFLIAVSKMAVDAAPEVRHHGQQMLQGLAQQKEFSGLWDKLIPAKDRRPLQKILQRMGR